MSFVNSNSYLLTRIWFRDVLLKDQFCWHWHFRQNKAIYIVVDCRHYCTETVGTKETVLGKVTFR